MRVILGKNWDECSLGSCATPSVRWYVATLSSGLQLMIPRCLDHPSDHPELGRDEVEVWKVMEG